MIGEICRHEARMNFVASDKVPGGLHQKKESLFSQVTDFVAGAIMSGQYKVGELLPNEDDLRGDITVSRTAYREAIKFLSAKGLIEARPKSGTRVAAAAAWNLLDPDVLRWSLEADPNEAFIRELYELRRFIEPNATKSAAERCTREDLLLIEQALLAMETEPFYSEASINADVQFHEAIFNATRNRALMCLKPVIGCTILWSMRLKSDKASFAESLANHRRIYQAVANKDGERAAALSKILVLHACDDTLNALQSRRVSTEMGRE
jgi:GntR family transcriptional regulator, galactonate operon transcriptional repressor